MKNVGHVRIISGKFKGRKIPVINAEGLRPTTDRVKETIFNWLMFEISSKNVLDLFSGSGSLGFEALSRNAKQVTMVEANKQVYDNLIHVANTCHFNDSNNLNILHTKAELFLKNTKQSFDIIFMDPPFRKGFLESIIPLLSPNIMPQNCLVYIEQEKELINELPKQFKLQKESNAGQVLSRLFKIDYLDC
ncbi:MAG: 16S rRNA (guanine(966)-N(2))-methyltransferase RsmD [Succinivibrionaceae bacterium]